MILLGGFASLDEIDSTGLCWLTNFITDRFLGTTVLLRRFFAVVLEHLLQKMSGAGTDLVRQKIASIIKPAINGQVVCQM